MFIYTIYNLNISNKDKWFYKEETTLVKTVQVAEIVFTAAVFIKTKNIII